MPSSVNYKEIVKPCQQCGEALILNNVRDITRKNFCSQSCRGSYGAKIRKLPKRTCFVCDKEYQSKVGNQKFCSKECSTSKQVERSYKYLNNNLDAYIAHVLCKPGRKHLSVADITTIYKEQQGLCAVSKVPLTCIKIPNTKKVHTNLSIDRIDSTKGYEIGNIQLVCAIVNIMKSTLTMTELAWWAEQIHGGYSHS